MGSEYNSQQAEHFSLFCWTLFWIFCMHHCVQFCVASLTSGAVIVTHYTIHVEAHWRHLKFIYGSFLLIIFWSACYVLPCKQLLGLFWSIMMKQILWIRCDFNSGLNSDCISCQASYFEKWKKSWACLTIFVAFCQLSSALNASSIRKAVYLLWSLFSEEPFISFLL